MIYPHFTFMMKFTINLTSGLHYNCKKRDHHLPYSGHT